MHTRSPYARFAAIAVALLIGTGVAACSSDGDDAEKATTTAAADGDVTTTAPDDGGSDEPTDTTVDGGDEGADATTTAPDEEPASDVEEGDYIDAMVTELTNEEDGAGFPTDVAGCLAEEWVGIIGFDTLTAAGVTPDELAELEDETAAGLDLDEATANDMYDALGTCGFDFKDYLTELFASEEELNQTEKACINRVLTDENLRRSFVSQFQGEELEDDPLDEVLTCFPDMGFSSDTADAESATD